MTIMTYTLEGTRKIKVADILIGKRMYEPSEKHIKEMVVSLDKIGQLTPIVVYPVTHNSWRLVAGNTRLRAALKLGLTHIRADIICGAAIDYQIIELTENTERRALTAAQRREAKMELKKLLRDKLVSVKAAKGGRGKKGGLREAAREVGIPRTTAQRETKVAHNSTSGPVSETHSGGNSGVVLTPARAPSIALEQMVSMNTSIRFTDHMRERINRYNAARCGNCSLGECIRKIVDAKLTDEGF